MANFLTMIETASGWQFVVPGGANPSGANPSGADSFETITLDSTAPESLAEQASTLIDSKGGKVFLAIRSDQAMAANLPIASGKLRGDREALTFLLEEQLPVGAEQIVADFVTSENHALGIAVETQAYRPLILALEQAGLQVQAIAPAATILAQEICKSTSDEDDFVLLDGTDGWELFQLQGGAPTHWWFQSSSMAEAPFQTELLTASALAGRPLRLRTFADADIEIPGLEVVKADTAASRQTTFEARIHDGLRHVADGSEKLWFDLHRGQLAIGDPLRELRGPMRMLAIAILCLMFAAGAAAYLRANRLEAQMQQLQQSQRALFAEALPSQKVAHGGILSRLKSHVKSMRGARDRTQDIELAPSAVLVMQRLLNALQEADEFEVRETAIENGQIDVDLAVPTFSDVNGIIESLQSHGFRMSPPSSSQEGDLVLSRLLGNVPDDLLGDPATAAPQEQGSSSNGSASRSPAPLRESMRTDEVRR